LHADAETQIPNTQIREQQNDRSKILKPSSFLPKDPMLLTLMNMQKSGGFVSNILGDGRSLGWAPELRGILSLEVVSRPSHKRKRDSGVADLGSEEDEAAADKQPTPQLEFEQSELDAGVTAGFGEDPSLVQGEEVLEQLPADEGVGAPEEEQFQEDEAFSPADNFDDTTVPLLHPAESGPISVGTKHAVHLLRERFGAEAETDESARQKTSVLFQDMLPEATTTKADATKMFFEVLVLATKDAIKVEQPVNELGGPLRIRGKRGLWGSWAETSAGGELASQVAPTASPAVVAES
jgi:cohesin complex subunit SCC1